MVKYGPTLEDMTQFPPLLSPCEPHGITASPPLQPQQRNTNQGRASYKTPLLLALMIPCYSHILRTQLLSPPTLTMLTQIMEAIQLSHASFTTLIDYQIYPS